MTLTIRGLSSVLCLLVAGVFALVESPGAQASSRLQVGIQDDNQAMSLDPATQVKAFADLAELRMEVLRVTLWWNKVAPTQPTEPRNPGAVEYEWGPYDEVVKLAKEKNIEIVFTILGTPAWANGGRKWFYAPSAAGTTLKDFAYAAAKRYSGGFPEDAPLPKVSRWTAWNEPNLSFWLRPLSYKPRRHLQALAGAYARICNAVRVGVHEAGTEYVTSEIVACGVTAPTSKGRRFSYMPLTFLRAIKAAGAKFDVYAHNPHPRSPSETPSTRPRTPGVIVLGNIDLLMKQLTRSYGAKRLWLTEYAYQTKPQDRWVGVTWARQAKLMKQAYAKARKHRRIDMLIWFLLVDEPDLNGARFGAPGWQSGLITVGGRRKNAFAAFRNMPH